MWIQVRTFDGKTSKQIDGLSKLTKIEDLQEKLVEAFDAQIDTQRLYYRGKQLVPGHTLFDYDVGLNNIIQLMIRKKLVEPPEEAAATDTEPEDHIVNGIGESDSGVPSEVSDSEPLAESKEESQPGGDEPSTSGPKGTYKVKDVIDAMDLSVGAWFEAEIIKVAETMDLNNNEEDSGNPGEGTEKQNGSELTEEDGTAKAEGTCEGDGLVYHVRFEDYDEQGIVQLSSNYLRPRARTLVPFEDIAVGDVVMANYNCDDPTDRGFWYDVEVKSLKKARTVQEVIGNIRLGPGVEPLTGCRVRFTDELFKIEKAGEVSCDAKELEASGSPIKRTTQPDCNHCKDKPTRKCKYCSCHQCGGKDEPDKQIMCDECDMAYHIYCLDPPLPGIPDEDEWYCPICKNDNSKVVHAGEKLKGSKKKSKMASASSTSSRDWGKGMACQGRTKICTIVPPNHFGSIPGIHVGQTWKFRVQVSEAGVHRPHVAGIHGREIEGAYSIVLAGGYEDDEVSEAGVHRPQVAGIHGREVEGAFSIVLSGAFEDEQDNGDDFTYTGSGGRDLSGNKRTAEQSCDQKLTKYNLALARNCNATLDKVKGNEAKDWRGGRPVRVVRNAKGRKHSKYAPEEGNRYDGIYKIVKYWPEMGKSGFLVWRYLLRRDDPQSAPWSKEGKARIKKLGLTIEYPEGYLEAMAAKEKAKEEEREKDNPDSDQENEKKPKKKGKRKLNKDSPGQESPSSKKVKHEVPDDFKKQAEEDTANAKIWKDVMESVLGGEKLLTAVEEAFTCICCQEVAYDPITTPCLHNVCKCCLKRSFQADVRSCPYCRYDLGKGFTISVNSCLAKILLDLFPGYNAGR